MATTAKNAPGTSKKELEQQVIDTLGKALESFKEIWGEKKFASRVKKSSKHFLKGMPQKIEIKAVKPAKKKATSLVAKKTAAKSKAK